MKTLEDLLKIDGVLSAFDFSVDGKLIDYRGNIDRSRDYQEMSSHFCATVTMLFSTLASAFTGLSGEKWVPQNGWMYSGGLYSVCIGGRRGVVVETAKADFNQLFQALVGEREERARLAA